MLPPYSAINAVISIALQLRNNKDWCVEENKWWWWLFLIECFCQPFSALLTSCERSIVCSIAAKAKLKCNIVMTATTIAMAVAASASAAEEPLLSLTATSAICWEHSCAVTHVCTYWHSRRHSHSSVRQSFMQAHIHIHTHTQKTIWYIRPSKRQAIHLSQCQHPSIHLAKRATVDVGRQ